VVVSPKAAAHQSWVLAEWMNGFDCSFHIFMVPIAHGYQLLQLTCHSEPSLSLSLNNAAFSIWLTPIYPPRSLSLSTQITFFAPVKIGGWIEREGFGISSLPTICVIFYFFFWGGGEV
jgi:hypothetical protein